MTTGRLVFNAVLTFGLLALAAILVGTKDYPFAVVSFGVAMVNAMIVTAECAVADIRTDTKEALRANSR